VERSKDYAAILGSSARVFPGSSSKFPINDTASVGCDPGIDGETRAGLETVRLARVVTAVKCIKKRGGGKLG